MNNTHNNLMISSYECSNPSINRTARRGKRKGMVYEYMNIDLEGVITVSKHFGERLHVR